MNTDGRLTRWFLFDGGRERLALLFLAGGFCLLVGLGQAGVLALTDSDAVDVIAGGLVPGLFTFLSIVLGINQLVLTQSSGSADEIRERVADVREFREAVERRSGSAPAPLVPTDFLSVLVGTIDAKAADLHSAVEDDRSAAGEAARAYATAVRTAAERANRRVERSDPGRVNAVISLLDYDDSGQLYHARRLLADHREALPPDARRAIHDLVEVLELFDVARTHFRTTYTQRTLARLSRLLLYAGLPAIVATFVLGMSSFPDIDGWRQVVVVSGLLTAALSPLAILSSYILRVAAVSERTIGVGPFVSRPDAENEFQVPGGSREGSQTGPSGNEGDDGSAPSDRSGPRRSSEDRRDRP